MSIDGHGVIVRRGRAALNLPPTDLDDLAEIAELMGKRFQAEYLAGAIPWLKENELELWARLTALDEQENLDSIVEYENLFIEGLRRYADFKEKLASRIEPDKKVAGKTTKRISFV